MEPRGHCGGPATGPGPAPAPPPRPHLRQPPRPRPVGQARDHHAPPSPAPGSSGGAEPRALPAGVGAGPSARSSWSRRRGPSLRVPAPPRGLRHVPRPAGAAAAACVCGCRGRRSTPPAAFVRILRRGRWLAPSPALCAPTRLRRRARARAHSARDRSLAPSPRCGGGSWAGPGSRGCWRPIEAREGSRRPRPQGARPSVGRCWRNPAHAAGMRVGWRRRGWGSVCSLLVLPLYAIGWWEAKFRPVVGFFCGAQEGLLRSQ